ncbi:MAG: hypothetical protein NC090_05305 [Anaeroplasma bactoclasticum]|nr:hypothetical protein [Staphylococcus sp.]MCM1350676.1 hypothetical protein [Prevotella sp.]MCM1514388.1 hypothetical protein [Anaeroplasma bactoclasticum]
MKYNKQLFDLIHTQYLEVMHLSEFIIDNAIEQTELFSRYDILANMDLYAQAVLAKVIMKDNPKNPALFNMLKKLSAYTSFYQGIHLDDWLNNKEKVLNEITQKIDTTLSHIPTLIELTTTLDAQSKTTELSYQLLEAIIGLTLTLMPEQDSFERVEKEVLEVYLSELYQYIQTHLE